MATCASYMVAALILFDKKIAIFAFHEMELMLYDGHYCQVASHSFFVCRVQAIFTIFFYTGHTEQIILSLELI